MGDFDKPLTPDEISERTKGAISAEAVREFCHRGPAHHPLPHVRIGRSGKHIRVRWSVFTEWYREEEARNAA